MKPIKKTMLLLASAALVLPMLAACDHIQGGRKQAAVVSAEEEERTSTESNVPVAQMPSDAEIRNMTTVLSNGAVEVYDLDGDGYQAGGVPSVTQSPQGIPFAMDPRVTVFPVDDYAQPPGLTYGGGVLTPEWPNSSYPADYNSGAMDPGKMPSYAGRGVSSVYFNDGSARLSPGDRSVLNTVAETAKFAPVDRVSVEGHASSSARTSDPIKAKILNLKESMNRAQAVSQDLIQRGVPAEKLKTVAWGDTKPSGAGEAQQRRVDIITGGGQ